MSDITIPLQLLLEQKIYQTLIELSKKQERPLELLIEDAITQYIADQSLDGSGWSSVFEKLVADDHHHLPQKSPGLKAAEIIAKKEELKRKLREENRNTT